MFGPCIVRHYLLSFLVLTVLWRGRKSWLLSFWCLVTGSVMCPYLTVLCQSENPKAQF